MKFETLRQKLQKRPFFESLEIETLLGQSEQAALPRISRWVNQGKLIQLRRGKYLLPPQYQVLSANPFYISNYLYCPSYVSLYTALQYYGCIPEAVKVIQAVTTRQTASWETAIGRFQYFSIKPERFFGYTEIKFGNGEQQRALIADLEKALIDVCYFSPGEWNLNRWSELRLQHCELINLERLRDYSAQMKSIKIERSIDQLIELLRRQEFL
ncbi:MAG TPA: hypothetical protein P5268_09580 [Candidatus Marinimicrobia bacterium]|nr:hypothetical protein [Candidatus Neomarinimicrobiota bacterium]HRS52569.1 hypothetical protein [Candidatus Neomarinimicrobiota bacterium]HRU93262.1 hypothetical protein [Candidatus Neomarinimicrobiota bacterium]